MVAVFLACIVVLAALVLMRQSPLWWRPVRADHPRTIGRAEAIEQRLINGLHEGRPADPSYRVHDSWRSQRWTLRVSSADATAWLNVRLPRWLVNRQDPVRLPPELEQVQVAFEDGRILVGAQVRAAGERRILSATLDPGLDPDGALWLPARWVHLGRLPVPAAAVLEGEAAPVRSLLPPSVLALPEVEEMVRAFAGEAPILERPVLRLDDGRRVRLLAITARDGILELTCQTETGPDPRRAAAEPDQPARARE